MLATGDRPAKHPGGVVELLTEALAVVAGYLKFRRYLRHHVRQSAARLGSKRRLTAMLIDVRWLGFRLFHRHRAAVVTAR